MDPHRQCESTDSTDDEDTATLNIHSFPPNSRFLFPASAASTPSVSPLPSRSTSPLPQFYPSPHSGSSCPSESESEEPTSPLLLDRAPSRNVTWRAHSRQRSWWSISGHRRQKRTWRLSRVTRRWLRRLVRSPFFPSQPITIVLTLILFSIFAISLTLLLIYVLNPDKEPLPWRAYCSHPSLAPPFNHPLQPNTPHFYPNFTDGRPYPPFPHAELDRLPPAGVFVGVFSVDSAFDRRNLVRTTWASHPRSREGANEGDDGVGTSRTLVRFVLGQPSREWERRVKLEMEMYNDIIILPIAENMNGGKSHTYFSWAAINAWVPPVYTSAAVPPPSFSYSNFTSTPPPLAPHDPFLAWQDINSGSPKPWVRPDYVVKVDDDSFVMLAELEARLRLELHSNPRQDNARQQEHAGHGASAAPNTTHHPSAAASLSPGPAAGAFFSPSHRASIGSPATAHNNNNNQDPLIYWGYLVTNRLHMFMAGELYALSWSLVDWASKDPTVKMLTRGAEDKQTASWMRIHPRASEVRWTSERCWIYDHPRSGTVYAHGFLFPSEVTRVRKAMDAELERAAQQAPLGAGATPTSVLGSGTPAAWGHSSVSTFHARYTPPLPDLSTKHSVEALVEGSDMSLLREGNPMTPDYAWSHREGRRARYEGNRVGGTVVVHYIKKNMWYLETALALLEGEEQSEAERYESSRRTQTQTNQVVPVPVVPGLGTGLAGQPHAYQRKPVVMDLHGRGH